MKNMLLVLLLFTSIDLAYAQSIRGAEFVKQATVDQELVIQLKVYREGASKDAIDLDWGDGQTETLPLTYFELSTSGFRIDTYSAIHEYDTAGYYELTFRDSFLVADVLNIQDSHNKFINLKDSVLIFEANHPFSSNYMPEFWPRQSQRLHLE